MSTHRTVSTERYLQKGLKDMKITVCIGSSCHIKGSRQVVTQLRELLQKYELTEKVELAGTFCLGQCQQCVCVTVDEEVFSVKPEEVDVFFKENVLTRL